MNAVRKYVFPFSFSLGCILAYYILPLPVDSIAANAGPVLTFLYTLVFYYGFILFLFLFAVPFYCFTYSRKLLRQEKWKYLFTVYNALILTVFFACVCKEDQSYIYCLLLFFWAEAWNLLPLLIHKKQQTSSFCLSSCRKLFAAPWNRPKNHHQQQTPQVSNLWGFFAGDS